MRGRGTLADDLISPPVTAALAATTSRRWLSPLSVWEALLLIERTRLKVDVDAHDWVRQALAVAPVEEAPVTTEVALASRGIAAPMRKRFCAGTADVEVTS